MVTEAENVNPGSETKSPTRRARRKKKKKNKCGKHIVLYVFVGLIILILGAFAVLWVKGRYGLQQDTLSDSSTLVATMKDKMAGSEAPKDTASNEQKSETQSADMISSPEDQDLSDCILYNGKYYRYNEDILTFLIMGIDQRSKTVQLQTSGFDAGSADALFLAVLNPHTKRIQIVGINRNTMADVEIYDENFQYEETIKTQICVQHGFLDGGESSCKLVEKAVSKYMYDLPIAGYCAVNMKAVGDINDAIGGVTLEILDDMTWYDPTLKKGETIHLSGKQAYVYTTRRKINEWASTDKRYKRQRQYLSVFVKQAKEKIKEDPTLVPTLYNEMKPYMTTDVGIDKAVYLSSLVSGFDFSGSDIIHFDGKMVLEDGYEAFYADEEARFEKTLDVFFEEVPTAASKQ